MGLSHQISRRVSASGGYGAYSSEWSAASRQTLHYGRAGISVGIARGLNARAGYGYRQGRYGEGPDPRLVRNHTIDAGVDFSRSLSFSRRTTFSFSTGSTAIRDGSQTHFSLTGQAQLNRELGRSWRATVGYSRDVRFIEQFQEVLLSDGVNASVGGLINRRQSFYASAGVSIGNVGFTAGQNVRLPPMRRWGSSRPSIVSWGSVPTITTTFTRSERTLSYHRAFSATSIATACEPMCRYGRRSSHG